MLRGVAWRPGEVELWRLWRDVARAWPAPLAEAGDGPGAGLLAHAGAAMPLCGGSCGIRHDRRLALLRVCGVTEVFTRHPLASCSSSTIAIKSIKWAT